MINLILRGIKRLFLGSTSVFAVRNGSAAFSGSSFAQVYRERAAYPLRIVGIQFQCDPSAQGEWRVTVDGERIFPYNEVNPMDSEFHHLVTIEIAAGDRFEIEVRSRNQQQKGVIILEELDVIEMR